MALPTLSDITLYVNKVLTGKDWNKNFQAILKWFTDGTTDIKVKSIDIPATGNITNAGTLVQTGISQFSSDVAITGNLTATGNITADKFVGDGSLLTNVVVSGLANYTPFTVNSGNLDANGDGEILSFEVGTPETLNFKVGTPYANLIATRADSTTFTLTEISDIDVSSLTNGTYTICVLKDVIIAEVCGTVFRQKIAPVTAQQDDIWLDTSTELIKSYKYDTGIWVAYNGVPIGTVTVNTGVCTAVSTLPYNANGVNRKLIKSYQNVKDWYNIFWQYDYNSQTIRKFIEQGGEDVTPSNNWSSSKAVTFLIPMFDTYYYANAATISNSAVFSGSISTLLTTGMTVNTLNRASNADAASTFRWEVKGYIS